MHKDTKGKLKLNLIPTKALKAVARVREFGCSKYPSPDGNSYLKDVRSKDLVEAAWRHILLHNEGELLDSESSETHLAHAATSLMMALEIKYKTMEDNDFNLRDAQSLHRDVYKSERGLTRNLKLEQLMSQELPWGDIPDGRDL